jgi:hypothetical protein
MPYIRIIKVPPGEAPESVRQAWVGLSLPLAEGQGIRPTTYEACGVLSGPKDLSSTLAAWVSKRFRLSAGYAVETLAAVEILSHVNPEAAGWWYQKVPYLTMPGEQLIFPASVCEIET